MYTFTDNSKHYENQQTLPNFNILVLSIIKHPTPTK